MGNMEEILNEGRRALKAAQDSATLENVKALFIGKNGAITQLLKALADLPAEDKRQHGAAVNQLKQQFEAALQARREELAADQLSTQLNSDALDITLPGRGLTPGSLHPITLTRLRMEQLFSSIGFAVADGPEIETDFYNFEALNMPADHPARAMQDTFYLEDGKVLRTHTSPVQIRYMQTHTPPIKIIAPGRVFRVDWDATHSPMFHQIEGLWIEEGVSLADLKGVLIDFLRQFFEREALQVRFRPSFFPFTEPSAEVDVLGDNGWLEVGGCGIVHPKVLENGGIDSTRYTGFAFGMGIDRFAMLYYGVNDLRQFFENDLSFLTQFG
jgi:phenylalanyl-tRNA synthetase alpha chain